MHKIAMTMTKQIVELDDGAAKTIEPSRVSAMTTPRVTQCKKAA